MLDKLDHNVVVIGIIVLAGIMFILGRLISRRTKDLNHYNETLTKKMAVYAGFTRACRIAQDTEQLSTYREVHEKAREVLELVDDQAKDAVMEIIVMTDKKFGRPDKAEFIELCNQCMEALNEELYRKPPKRK